MRTYEKRYEYEDYLKILFYSNKSPKHRKKTAIFNMLFSQLQKRESGNSHRKQNFSQIDDGAKSGKTEK